VIVAGVDGGGTKTDAVVCDADGHVLGYARAGTGNWEIVGLDGALAAVTSALDGALAEAGLARGALAAVAFALAGVDWPSDVERLEPLLAPLGGGPRAIVNDAFAAMRAGTRAPHGCVSVAGTGAVSAGRNREGRIFRTMGNGLGEGRGAGSLVHEALDAVARWRNGGAPPTLLTERFLETFGDRSVDALFERLMRAHAMPGSEHAPLVLAAAADGDPAAIAVAEGEGRRLGESVCGVARTLGMQEEPFELVRSGGVALAGSPALDDAFLAVVRAQAPLATVTPLMVPPVAGAALLALDLLDAGTPDAHDELASEVLQVERLDVEAAA
jgi:N-acetylglucosamine kinase-like BadF-type ATPase